MLAVVGPTASGKSSVAIDIARERIRRGRPTELVAIDAFTVYRGMDVGTAKPSPAERAEVPHHLIDILDPAEELSVAAFRDRARVAIDEVAARGATPVLVGGSGLYFRAVVDPLRFPPTDPEVRAALEDRWEGRSEEAHARLEVLDPIAAERIAPENLRRTIRALEVLELTGERFSDYDAAYEEYRSIYPGLRVAFLDPPNEVLRPRISTRSRWMVAAGLLEEVRALRAAGPWSRTAAQAIGYAEASAVLDARLEPAALAERISQRTWRYARRQRSWFRRDPRCRPLAAEDVAAWLRGT
ncbi:MAG: tRNA (adenosine(37)-N6)-dimethylallyltransferase MiaA [Nitriliruptoraceae bacterium]